VSCILWHTGPTDQRVAVMIVEYARVPVSNVLSAASQRVPPTASSSAPRPNLGRLVGSPLSPAADPHPLRKLSFRRASGICPTWRT
jgi:hypothetical protein